MRRKMTKEELEVVKLLQPIGDKLVKVGWAKSYGYGPVGVGIELTPVGKKMFRSLWRVQRELAKVDFRTEDLKPLAIFVQLIAARAGWE